MQKIIVTLFLLHVVFAGFSQNDSSQYQKFFTKFLSLYRDFSKPPLKNYYEILSNTGKFSVNVSDLAFVNALAEISKEKKVLEDEAIDLLLEQVYTDLRNKYLWVTYRDIYDSKRNVCFI